MQVTKNNLLGKTKIYLFDGRMNLNQGRHIFEIIRPNYDNNDNDNEELELDEV
jgi:hypothetical protein